MQLLLEFLDPATPRASPLPTTPWDQLDKAARVAVLEILARLIARMLAARQPEQTRDD